MFDINLLGSCNQFLSHQMLSPEKKIQVILLAVNVRPKNVL